MRLVFLYKYMNCTMDKTTLVTLLTYINYITSILLTIFRYYLLAPVANI